MRNTIKTISTLTLACLACHAPAQEKASPPPAPKPATFDISFPGGNAKQLVAALEKSVGRPLNILIPPELLNTPFPKVEFKAVDLPSLFRALDLAQGNRGVQWANVSSDVMVLMARPETLETGVYYVGHLLTKFGIDDVTTAVQTAWAMDKSDSSAELKYHQETKLLIVRGPKKNLNMVKDVLSELSHALPGSPSTPPASN